MGKKVKRNFFFLIHQIFKLLSASALLATFANPARSSMAHQLRRLSPPNGLIEMALSDSTTVSR